MNLTGKQTGTMNGREMAVQQTVKIAGENTQLLTRYGPGGDEGKEFKIMQIKYTRKK